MSPPPEDIGRADVSRLLRLDGAPARLLVLLFVVANAVFMVTTADRLLEIWPALLAMVIVWGTAVLLVRDRPDPFPWPDTVMVLAAVATSTLLMSTVLPVDSNPGRVVWHLGANTWLLFFLALRNRAFVAWLGMGLMSAITAVWGEVTGLGGMQGLSQLQSHMGILLVGTLFAMILRSTSVRINVLNERSVRSAVDAAATEAARQVRRVRVTELATVAVPLLEKISSGAPLTADDRMEFALTEAQLRDSVRGRSLAVPAVETATSRARRRGVEVMLLDDRGEGIEDGAALERMVTAIVEVLDAATGGQVTVRLQPAGRSTAVTIVAADGDHVTRLTLDNDGHPAPAL